MQETRERRETAVEPAREPARRWRNWWLSPRSRGVTLHAKCSDCGADLAPIPANTPTPDHCMIYPSRDVAETAAIRWVMHPKQAATYLGAFPEGERP